MTDSFRYHPLIRTKHIEKQQMARGYSRNFNRMRKITFVQ